MLNTPNIPNVAIWVDADHLIGAKDHPEKWSSGNALLDTATVLNLLLSNDPHFEDLLDGINRCRSIYGAYDKNPGRPDEITHDDLIGVASISPFYARELCADMEKQHGFLSNTGKRYFTAWVKPWHRAFYQLMAGHQVSYIYLLAFCLQLLLMGMRRTDASGSKLVLLQTKALLGICKDLGLSTYLIRLLTWTKHRILAFWGSERALYAEYYGPEHIITKLAEWKDAERKD